MPSQRMKVHVDRLERCPDSTDFELTVRPALRHPDKPESLVLVIGQWPEAHQQIILAMGIHKALTVWYDVETLRVVDVKSEFDYSDLKDVSASE